MTRIETWISGSLVSSEDLPDPVPEAITAAQCRIALLRAGLADDIEAYVSTQPTEVRVEWEYATEVRRDHPLLCAGAAAIGMSASQVDDLFRAAALI